MPCELRTLAAGNNIKAADITDRLAVLLKDTPFSLALNQVDEAIQGYDFEQAIESLSAELAIRL